MEFCKKNPNINKSKKIKGLAPTDIKYFEQQCKHH